MRAIVLIGYVRDCLKGHEWKRPVTTLHRFRVIWTFSTWTPPHTSLDIPRAFWTFSVPSWTFSEKVRKGQVLRHPKDFFSRGGQISGPLGSLQKLTTCFKNNAWILHPLRLWMTQNDVHFQPPSLSHARGRPRRCLRRSGPGGYHTLIPISYWGRGHLAMKRSFAFLYNRPLHHRRLQNCCVCLFRTPASASLSLRSRRS